MKSMLYIPHAPAKSLIVFLLIVFSANLFAQQATLSVQGVLTKSDGTAVDDGNEYILTFRLWKSESGTAPVDKVHEETIQNISIVGGVYSVVLGVNPDPQFHLDAPFNTTYWLGVSVGTSSVELLPRPRLTHAPYALGLVGQNNIFPSTGPVIGDAFRAKGGPAVGGQGPTANGYSFHTVGDDAGGMFSEGGNNIELWAGATKKVKLTNGLNELYGPTNTNDLTVYGNETVNGNSTINFHQTVQGTHTVNGLQVINTNQIVNGFSTVTENQTVDLLVKAGSGLVNKAFTNTGIFWSAGNHDIIVNVNGNNRILIGDNGVNYFNGPTVFSNGDFNVQNIPFGDHRTMQYDNATGKFYWDNSSRRYKENITEFNDDFSLILKSQPKTYTRPGAPDRWEIGYIAEEMDSIGLKNLMEYNSVSGVIEGFNYEKMILYVVEVLKTQDAAITQLQSEVAQLKAENTGLTNQNTTLKTNNDELEKQQEVINKQLAGLLMRMQALEASKSSK